MPGQLLLRRLPNPSQQPQQDVFAVRFYQEGLDGTHRVSVGANAANKKIAHANLDCRMHMQFGLFYCKQSLLRAQCAYDDRHHLKSTTTWTSPGATRIPLLKSRRAISLRI